MGKYLIISIVGLYGLFAIITKLCQLYKNMEEKSPNEKEDFYKEFGNLSKKERKEIKKERKKEKFKNKIINRKSFRIDFNKNKTD